MSGKAPKQKGNRIERECVNLAKGFGWHEEVDMVIETKDFTDPDAKLKNTYKFQVKGRKKIGALYKPCEHVYGQILKEDRQEPLVTIRYKDLLMLFKRLTG